MTKDKKITITVRYPTKERNYLSPGVYQNVSKDVTLTPIRIIRRPCGEGDARHRYFYVADFEAPTDAEFARDGIIQENINRKANRKFNPKKLIFKGNTCTI